MKFGSADAATYSVDSDTQITATAPAGADTVDVRITIPIGGISAMSAADEFAYVAAPTVTSLTPATGPDAGAVVVITGTHFNGASAVKFGANDATTYTIDSDTQIDRKSVV